MKTEHVVLVSSPWLEFLRKILKCGIFSLCWCLPLKRVIMSQAIRKVSQKYCKIIVRTVITARKPHAYSKEIVCAALFFDLYYWWFVNFAGTDHVKSEKAGREDIVGDKSYENSLKWISILLKTELQYLSHQYEELYWLIYELNANMTLFWSMYLHTYFLYITLIRNSTLTYSSASVITILRISKIYHYN